MKFEKQYDPSLKPYLKEISQQPALSPAEEIELAHRIQAGDEAARETMIQSNLKLVVKIAKDYEGMGLPLSDLVAEGNIGLMKAVDRFETDRGAKLSTYAAWWIKQSMRRALGNQSKTIRIPTHVLEKLRKIRRTEQEFHRMHGRNPSNEELAEILKLKPWHITHWRTMAQHPVSLNATANDEDMTELQERVGDESNVLPADEMIHEQVVHSVERYLKRLDTREREILKHRYGLNGGRIETLDSVGLRFNITRERVRQIQNSAVIKIRSMLEEEDSLSQEQSPVSL